METSGKCYLCGKTDGDLSDITTRSNGKCDMLGHISDPSNAQSQGTKSSSNDSAVLGGSDPPSTPEKESDVANTEACNECKSALREQLPELPCSGCKEVFYVVCYGHPNKTDFSEVPKEAKIRWKCNTCFKCPEGSKIGWKCPTCFARDSFCGSCGKPAENPSHILRCKKCQQVYDSFCVGVKIEKFRQMTPEQKDKWQCEPCILRKVKKTAKKIGIPLAIGAGLTAAVLGGIPLVVAGLGFGSAGVVGGSVAAAYQSAFLGGNILAGSAFSVLQSVGAVGLAGSTQAGISGVCMAIPFVGSKIKDALSDTKESKSFIFLIKDHQIYRVLVSLS